MKTLYDNDIDYEQMDDLPLAEHIEWSQHRREDIVLADFDFDSEDWFLIHENHKLIQDDDTTDSIYH